MVREYFQLKITLVLTVQYNTEYILSIIRNAAGVRILSLLDPPMLIFYLYLMHLILIFDIIY